MIVLGNKFEEMVFMIIWKGQLRLKDNTKEMDYFLHNNKLTRSYMINEKLNENLLGDVHIIVKSSTGTTLFNSDGELRRVKDRGTKLYNYKVDKNNLEDVLFDNVGEDIEFSIHIN